MKQRRAKKTGLKKSVRLAYGIIVLITTILLLYFICKLDMIPNKYLIVLSVGYLLLNLINILSATRKNKFLKIAGLMLLTIFLIINCIGIYYVGHANKILDNFFQEKKEQSIKYYIVSLSKNNLTKDNISGDIAYYRDSVSVDTALDSIKQKYDIDNIVFDDIQNMFDKLSSEEIKYMVLEQTNFNIIISIDENKKEEDYSILDEIIVKKKVSTNVSNNYDYFNVYLSGTDFNGLTDFNAIATVNTKTHEILLTSIPRDYYVDVVDFGYKNKLSFITEGVDVSSHALENLFGIQIDYFVKVDAYGIAKLVNKIGGVYYCSDYEYSGYVPVYNKGVKKNLKYYIKKGCQTLNGYQVIAAARPRNNFAGRDRVRQTNIQKLLISIMNKLVSSETLSNYNEIMNSMANSYETDIPQKVITKNIKDILNNGNKWSVSTQSVNGTDAIAQVHRYSNIRDWVMHPDMETVEQAKTAIQNILSNQ